MDTRLAGYFDYASSTPIDSNVLKGMLPFMQTEFYNPSSLYSASNTAKDAVDTSRREIAGILGVRQTEVIFTSGCTEANNLAIQGIMAANPGCKVVFSATEHESVRQIAMRYDHRVAYVGEDGLIDIDALANLIDDNVVLVSIIYINNETGVIQPLRKIAKLIAKIRVSRGKSGRPLYLHTDAAQAPNTHTIVRSALGVDLMSLNGGKVYGPKGVGCLFIDSEVDILPVNCGGGQERGIRSGTENTPAIVGFADALRRATDGREQEAARLSGLHDVLLIGLKDLGCTVITKNSPKSASIVSIILPKIDSETAVYKLDKLGVYVSSGSACHAKTGEKSHVLTAIGLSDEESMSTVRISLGRATTTLSIKKLLASIEQVLA